MNWDPKLGTAVSDLEVESEEEDGKLWHIRYPSASTATGDVIVATTRPETMLGDVAVAVNPEDERYTALVGTEVELPLTGRRIPVIADSYVDPAFGTGCVKITPAHDFNDWQVGQRHDLAAINVLTLDARINENGPAAYRGLDRFDARKRILADLEAQGLLVDTKPHKMVVPRCARTGEIVEPMLTDQWFVAMSKPAPEGTLSREIDRRSRARRGRTGRGDDSSRRTGSTVYNQWLTNIQDWCVSRQLWWGHQIPAWYDDAGPCLRRPHDEAEARASAAGARLQRPATAR